MIKRIIKSSFFYNVILRIVCFLRSLLKKSGIYALTMKEYSLKEKCLNSRFYSFKEKSIGTLHRKCRESAALSILENSFCGRFLKVEFVLPAFFFVMLVTPHEIWNNIYGVLGAFAIFMLLFFSKEGYSFKDVSIFVVIYLISAVGGLFITPSFSDGFKMLLFTVASLIFMRSTESGIKSEKSLLNLLWFLVCALLVMSIYAIVQNFIGVEAEEMLTDIVNNKGMPGRVYSTVENPNNFAEIIVLIIPFAFALFIISKSWRTKAFSAVIAICGILALMLTYTRGCYVSFAISVVVFIALYNWKWLMPLGLFGILCIPFLPQSVMNRLLTLGSLSDTSSVYRIYLWDSTAKLLKDCWLCGTGLGSEAFRIAYAPYAHRFAQNPAHSHMLYMQIFIELGVVGGVAFFGFMIASIRKGLKTYNNTNKTLRCIIIAAISSFAGISFSAATEYIWFYPRVMFTFFIVLGILLCAAKIKTEKSA